MDDDDNESLAFPWQGYIHSDPRILGGKPVVRGTRLAVDFILELFAAGWTEEQLFQAYPALTVDALRAIFAFAAERIGGAKDQTLRVGG